MNNITTKIGSFFFKYRNKVFPIMVAALFLTAAPNHPIIGGASYPLFSGADIISLGFILAGLAFRAVIIGFAYIKRGGLNKKVYADKLVTGGLFGVCRNPLYVGNMLICIGIFTMHQYIAVGMIGILIYFGIYQSIILTEEKYLKDKFGKEYDKYCKNVPRWIPKFLRLRLATKGMSFNFNRVIVKDYSTIGTAFISFLVIKLYQSWFTASASQTTNYALLIALVVFAVLAVRFLKKKKIIKE